MSLVNKMNLSLCSKEQKEGFIFPTNLPFLFTIDEIYLNRYSGINNLINAMRYNTVFYNKDGTANAISRGLIDLIKIIMLKNNSITDVCKRYILKPERFKSLKREINDMIDNKKIVIEKLETDVEYVIFFGKECTVSRVAFREFCNSNNIKFKITRDIKKANLFIGNFIEQYHIFDNSFRIGFRLFNINDNSLSLIYDPSELKYDYRMLLSNSFRSDTNLKEHFSLHTGIPLTDLDILDTLVTEEVEQIYNKFIRFLENIEPLSYSLSTIIKDEKFTPIGAHLRDIIMHSYYRIQNETNYKVLHEEKLQKQMIDNANVILNADKTAQCIDLIKNHPSHLLGCKLMCNVNLKESGIYGILLYGMFEIITYSRNMDVWRYLKRYTNRVEFKSFKNQYDKFVNDIEDDFLSKINQEDYCLSLNKHYYSRNVDISTMKGIIKSSLHFSCYNEMVLAKTKIISDIFNIPGLEEKVTLKFKQRIEELENNIDLKTIRLYSGWYQGYNGGSAVYYSYYLEILLKCLIEIEQQVTTGNEVVLNH